MAQYVGECHFWLRLCEIALAKMAKDMLPGHAQHNVR